jgi:hypothetical protein
MKIYLAQDEDQRKRSEEAALLVLVYCSTLKMEAV